MDTNTISTACLNGGPAPVPEPSSVLVLAMGLAGITAAGSLRARAR